MFLIDGRQKHLFGKDLSLNFIFNDIIVYFLKCLLYYFEWPFSLFIGFIYIVNNFGQVVFLVSTHVRGYVYTCVRVHTGVCVCVCVRLHSVYMWHVCHSTCVESGSKWLLSCCLLMGSGDQMPITRFLWQVLLLVKLCHWPLIIINICSGDSSALDSWLWGITINRSTQVCGGTPVTSAGGWRQEDHFSSSLATTRKFEALLKLRPCLKIPSTLGLDDSSINSSFKGLTPFLASVGIAWTRYTDIYAGKIYSPAPHTHQKTKNRKTNPIQQPKTKINHLPSQTNETLISIYCKYHHAGR